MLQWLKFNPPAWTPDHKGLYYSRFPQPRPGAATLEEANFNNKVYLHRLGTTQDKDELIYAVKGVAGSGDDIDDRLKEQFGGKR